MKQFFTFGHGHPFYGYYQVVVATGRGQARELMVKYFGTQWAFQYDSEDEFGVDKFGLIEMPKRILEGVHG